MRGGKRGYGNITKRSTRDVAFQLDHIRGQLTTWLHTNHIPNMAQVGQLDPTNLP